MIDEASTNRQFGQLPAGPSSAQRAPQFGQSGRLFTVFDPIEAFLFF
jgi:hypothetical protein